MKRERIEGTVWFKALIKHFGIFRDDPTSRELELLAEIQGRVALVVKARWILLLLLAIYGAYAGGFIFLGGSGAALDRGQILVLATSVAVVVAYNIFYQFWYRELAHFLYVNHLQILLDILFVTILVHFSGGALSWFWTVYLILTLEAAFLLERKGDAWFIGAAGALIYGALLMAEYYHLLDPVRMPFIDPRLQHDFVYEMLVWFWVSIMNATVAIVAAFLMAVIRERERELRLMVIKDQMTGLYNRSYFFKMLNSEIQRSLRYDHVFSIIMIDIDDFKHFNDTYGHLEGDRLLKLVAQTFRDHVRRSETDPSYDVDVPCRYGGEEFAIILPETPLVASPATGVDSGQSALAFAERVRREVEAQELDGSRVTISVGAAAFPFHGSDPDTLVKTADDALYRAKNAGKNRVVLAQ